MRIGIIGGGSTGLFFASELKGYLKDQVEITLYTRTDQQSQLIESEGVQYLKDGCVTNHQILSETYTGQRINDSILIISVKQYHLPVVLSQLHISDETTLLFTQNGTSHLTLLEQLSSKNVYLGVLEHGVKRTALNRVEYLGGGRLNYAAFRGGDSSFQELFTRLKGYGWPVIYKESYLDMLHEKLFVNAVINPMTAIFQIKNGELYSNKYYKRMAEQVFNELALVFKMSDAEATWNQICDVMVRTGENRSSMAEDIRNKRKTEIDAILGYVLGIAADKNIDVPVIALLYYGIRGLEEG